MLGLFDALFSLFSRPKVCVCTYTPGVQRDPAERQKFLNKRGLKKDHEVDHIHPVALGGNPGCRNVQQLHKSIHKLKTRRDCEMIRAAKAVARKGMR